MQSRRAFLGAAGAALLLPAEGFAQAGRAGRSFTGEWHFEQDRYTFVLMLAQAGKRLTGYHSAVTAEARRVDSRTDPNMGPPSIAGTVNGRTASVRWESGYGMEAGGTARITLREGQLEWKRLTHKGDHYFPETAVLSRLEPAPPTPHNRVVPGRSLGKIRLGATQAQVRATLGKPKQTRRFAGGLAEDRWVGKAPSNNTLPVHVSVFYRGGKAVQIQASSAAFRTPEGLSTESNFAQFQEAYGPFRVTAYTFEDAVDSYYDNPARGFAVTTASQNYILPHYRPEALIVHAPGVRVIPYPGGKPTKSDLDKTLTGD